MVIEGSDNIEMLKSDKSSSSKLFGDFYDICTKQINKIFLGHSGSLDSTPGKLGGENNIQDVRTDILQNDKALIAETVNKLIRHLCIINGFGEVQFRWQTEPHIENARINRDAKLQAMGVTFSMDYLKRTYNLQDGDVL